MLTSQIGRTPHCTRALGSIWFTLNLLIASAFGTPETLAIPRQPAKSQIASIEIADVTIESVIHHDGTVPQGQVTVAHHKVDAVIGGSIHIELLLPDDWNGRFVMGGGGGFCGTIQNPHRGAVNSGYATVGTDTGHRAKSIVDGSWALNDLGEHFHSSVLNKTGGVTEDNNAGIWSAAGGLLLRDYLSRERPNDLGHVVLIGTPNKGSELVNGDLDVAAQETLLEWAGPWISPSPSSSSIARSLLGSDAITRAERRVPS